MTIQILMRYDMGHISKYNLKLKKIKTCHPKEINKDYDAKKISKKKGLLKDIMHNY